jgi:hypothetical protein
MKERRQWEGGEETAQIIRDFLSHTGAVVWMARVIYRHVRGAASMGGGATLLRHPRLSRDCPTHRRSACPVLRGPAEWRACLFSSSGGKRTRCIPDACIARRYNAPLHRISKASRAGPPSVFWREFSTCSRPRDQLPQDSKSLALWWIPSNRFVSHANLGAASRLF